MFKSALGKAFRNNLAETIFIQKYKHQDCETWEELARTLVEDVCQEHLSKEDKAQLVQYIEEMKFIPGGRYLYYAGRTNRYYNNCLSGDTEFLTKEGVFTLREKVEQQVQILSPVSNDWETAQVQYFGQQRLNKITFSNIRGKSKKTWTIRATAEHRWPLTDGVVTSHLVVGDYVAARYQHLDIPHTKEGETHGMVFADGSQKELKNGFAHQLRLCGKKAMHRDHFSEDYPITYPPFANGDPIVYIKSERSLKELPTENDPIEYIIGFIKGWTRLDAHFGSVFQIHSINKEAIEFFIKYAPYCGYVVSGEIKYTDAPSNFGERKPLYWVNFSNRFPGFKVVDIQADVIEDVYCVVEPKHKQFYLADGIATGNCFLLNCLDDNREDWADLSWKAESCLTTGGGIGSVYSVYRGRGSLLHGTGGFASGPISKMKITNEIGREVMQGGSRRSAIWAGLHHWHPDVFEFLHVKDWRNLKVAGTDKTIADVKELDFNYPAPLDMTNISVLYDTDWLMKYWQTGDLGSVFYENCLQAMKTGEPGFAFNFFDKEKETLRNACTEVTSEDDSDVCNLGSLNLSRITSLNELIDVTTLATKFLICGTLRAKLPYEKVYQVREKNRRLGLGLMGLHEWLLQRGYKYEVTDDLRRWLTIYRDVSRLTADSFSAHLAISSPIACRAIAPTGSIGILAGTTTGIEPVYAVAIKRRYLKGNTWKYQYVIDATAKEFMERYAVSPESVESSMDLANDFERRIKFQADVQDYVDMGISSTINLPAWNTEFNNESLVSNFASVLARYAHRLRGFTVYPDGSRGGQPLVSVPYHEAANKLGVELEENMEYFDVCDISNRGGSCGT